MSASTSSAPESWSIRRDSRAYLWDVREAADVVAGFMQGHRFDDYGGDLMFRSAVERHLVKIGEALNQLARVDQVLAARIPELRRVVAFRNVLIHGYDQIDNAGVWRIVEADRRCAGVSPICWWSWVSRGRQPAGPWRWPVPERICAESQLLRAAVSVTENPIVPD